MAETAFPSIAPQETYVEIARFHHSEPARACAEILEEAGIPFRVSEDSLTPDISALQRGSNATCQVSVPEAQYVPARLALLNEAREEVNEGVGPDHPLALFPDEALLEVLQQPFEWNDFDIAVAERLLRKRGITPPVVSFERPAASTTVPASVDGSPPVGVPPLPGKRKGNWLFLIFGYVIATLSGTFAVPSVIVSLGGMAGLIIGFNYALATETLYPQGPRHYVFDEATRGQGKILLAYSAIMLPLGILWRVFLI